MGAFTTKKTLYGDTAKIPQVADQIRQAFMRYVSKILPMGNESLSLKVDFSKQHLDYALHWK